MALEAFLQYKRGIQTDRPINLLTASLRWVLCKLSEAGQAITAATNAGPIVVTIAGHGYSTGDRVLIKGVLGNTAANGLWTITVLDANTFSLDGSTGTGAYTSGGYALRLNTLTYLDDIAAPAQLAETANLANKAVSAAGIFDADDATITDPGGGDTADFHVLAVDSGDPETDNLIFIDNSFNLTLDGTNDTFQHHASGIYQL